MEIKICGITQLDQANAIVAAGADYLGFICVPTSPRYVTIAQIQAAIAALAEGNAPISKNIDKEWKKTIAEVAKISTTYAIATSAVCNFVKIGTSSSLQVWHRKAES